MRVKLLLLVDASWRGCPATWQKEEQILFPLISWLESGDVPPTPFVLQPIAAMKAEHDDAGQALAQMRRLTASLPAVRIWTMSISVSP